MNQILQVQENRKNNQIDKKKVVLFFAVCIIIFGLIYVGQGIYKVYQNKNNQKVNPNEGEDLEETEYVPIIKFTRTEENQIIVNVESQIAISHIIYSWNDEVPQTLNETGKTIIEEIIDIPSGENILNVSVIDSNGKETKKSSEPYVVEAVKPIIEMPSIIGNDIKIVVTSETELLYVTYKWNSEEEEKYDMLTFEDRTKFEKLIKIPKGQNTLKIVAVDINNVKTERTQEIKGIAKLENPIVKVKDGYIHFTFEAEDYMEKVQIIFNGKNLLMDTSTFGKTKVVNYKLKMLEGMNYLKLVGTTETAAINTTVWKYEYNP